MNISIGYKRWICFTITLIPLIILTWRLFTNNLGIDPYDTLIRETGEKALLMLILCLAITPLISIKFLAKKQLAIFKKPLGLSAFVYGVCHFLIFLVFDLQLNLIELTRIISEKPYVFVGLLALIILIVLAITSLKRMQKLLGGKNWKRLHQFVYLALILVILHFLWLSKTLEMEFWVYTLLTALLLGFRLYKFIISKFYPRMS